MIDKSSQERTTQAIKEKIARLKQEFTNIADAIEREARAESLAKRRRRCIDEAYPPYKPRD